MNQLTISIILVAVAVAVLSIAIYIMKKFRFNKIRILLQTQQYDAFFKLADSALSKYLFPRFNLEYLKLNAHILKGDEKKVEESFDSLLAARMNTKQKEDIYMKAFNWYVGLENKKKCAELIEVIQTFTNVELKREAQTIYDIFILKQANYIEEMEESLIDMNDNQKGVTEYLLSVQYENLKDKKKAKEYLALSKEHLRVPKEK